MTNWVVVRYVFDEDWKAWVPAGYKPFYSDEELLKFLKEQAVCGYKYRYEITTLRENKADHLPAVNGEGSGPQMGR